MTPEDALEQGLITRRQAFLVAGGAGLALVLHATPARADETVADPARLAVLAVVVAAVTDTDSETLRADAVQTYITRFTACYAEEEPGFRAVADAALDALDDANGGGFAALDAVTARARLRDWGLEERHGRVVADALSFAGLTFDDDHHGHTYPSLTGSAA